MVIKSSVAEKYIKVVQDMFKHGEPVVRWFKVGVK